MQATNQPSVKSSEDVLKNEVLDYELTYDFVNSLKPNVRMVDSDEELELYCYSTCDDSDPEYVKFCRGLVFDKEKNLILKAHSYTPEYTEKDYEFLKEHLEPIWNECSFFNSYEGAVIRVFNHSDKWYISTHRRLDAFKSKWAAKQTFGELFVSGLVREYENNSEFANFIGNNENFQEQFLSKLNKDYQYFFLLRPEADNRIVCELPVEKFVLHLGTFRNEQEVEDSIGLAKPEQRRFENIEEVLNAVAQTDIHETQGIVVFTPKNQIKILNLDYKYYYDIRGNEPSIKFRYLHLRMDNESRMSLMELYPSYVRYFDNYENILYDTVQTIKDAYIQRYIHKKFVRLPQQEYSVMKKCHEWHRENRNENRINFQKTMDILNTQSPTDLNKIVRRVINEENKKTEEVSAE